MADLAKLAVVVRHSALFHNVAKRVPNMISTLRGVGGRGVGDLNTYNKFKEV